MPDVVHGKICYLFLPSKDAQRSGAFYQRVFGWQLRTNDEGGLSFDDATGQVSGTWSEDKIPATEGLEIYIMVDSLESAVDAIRDAGGTVVDTDVHTDGERFALFSDVDGNRLGIYQQSRATADEAPRT
jgi:uncharacterized protein